MLPDTPRGTWITTDVPGRLDALVWSRWHQRVIVALGITWILDGLEASLVANVAPTLQHPETLGLSATQIGMANSVYLLGQVVGALRDLVVETGGDVIVANTPRLVDGGIRRLVEELRHQYLISFRANSFDGLRRVQVRTTRRDLTVRTRAWYFAGGEQQQ